jgi:hypothetical protein
LTIELTTARDDGWRFSLRLALIAMTLIAVFLGVIAADVYWDLE